LLLRGGLVNEDQARRQTQAATLIAGAVEQARLPDGRSALEVWRRIETVSAFYVGLSDDPGPVQYAAALRASDGQVPAMQRELVKYLPLPAFAEVARSPAPQRNVQDLLAQLEPTTGFRLFGQRFAPDVYALNKLVSPNVGPQRGLPDSLDLMALLGSPLARQLLKEAGADAFAGTTNSLSYHQALAKLQADFARFDDVDWNSNLYWSWLYTLQPLLRESAPPAYRAHLLNSALASWTQLRRDTVLYAKTRGDQLEKVMATTKKHTIIPGPARDHVMPVYLEPLPEVYGRLLALTRMTRQQLTALQVLKGKSFEQLERLLDKVVQVAEKELANEALSKGEEQFLHQLPQALRQLAAAPDTKQIESLQMELKSLLENKATPDKVVVQAMNQKILVQEYGPVSSPLVTTVAGDTLTGDKVLQTAIGRVDLAVFVVGLPDGSLMMAVGPVLTYYDWQIARNQERTEADWLTMLQNSKEPPRPPWTGMFLAPAKK
jgi:hypothetical protein